MNGGEFVFDLAVSAAARLEAEALEDGRDPPAEVTDFLRHAEEHFYPVYHARDAFGWEVAEVTLGEREGARYYVHWRRCRARGRVEQYVCREGPAALEGGGWWGSTLVGATNHPYPLREPVLEARVPVGLRWEPEEPLAGVDPIAAARSVVCGGVS